MNLRDLHYVAAVAELRSFSRAAEQCHVSQPTLSNQIKKMEEQLGVALFERTNKRVMPTETGRTILAQIQRILHGAEEIKAIAASARNPLQGPFRLGMFPTLAPYLLPSLLPEARRRLPDLQILVVEEKTASLLDKLHAGQLDAALLALPVEDPALTAMPLFDDAFLLAVPETHPLAERQNVTRDELFGEKLLLLEEGHCLRDQALEFCQAGGVAEEAAYRATSLETLRQLVKAGMGLTLMPQLACAAESDAPKGSRNSSGSGGGICYIPFAPPAPSRSIGMIARKTSPRMAAIEALAALLRTS